MLVRFPENRRSLDQLDDLRINTPMGSVPIEITLTVGSMIPLSCRMRSSHSGHRSEACIWFSSPLRPP